MGASPRFEKREENPHLSAEECQRLGMCLPLEKCHWLQYSWTVWKRHVHSSWPYMVLDKTILVGWHQIWLDAPHLLPSDAFSGRWSGGQSVEIPTTYRALSLVRGQQAPREGGQINSRDRQCGGCQPLSWAPCVLTETPPPPNLIGALLGPV